MRLFLRSFLLGAIVTSATVSCAQIPIERNDAKVKASNADDGMLVDGYTVHQSSHSLGHSIRIKEQNDSICDARSRQWTGWLDVGHKHLFFWYFESQNDPVKDPLTLWLTGGPGGSSMVGMMLEAGPCLVNMDGNSTRHNPYGWSAVTNMLFVDQPAGVGFSYLDKGVELPSNSYIGAEDMHIFLQIFISQAFPEKLHTPFHISGESYGGHYIPTLGAEIVRKNIARPDQVQVPLKSVLIGNGLVSDDWRTFGYWETLCTTKPGVEKPIFNSTRCDIIAKAMPRCFKATEACNKYPDVEICHAAGRVCSEIIDLYDNESYVGGRNRFDITVPCLGDDDMCYEIAPKLDVYLNQPRVWGSLDVPAHAPKKFIDTSQPINDAFSAGIDIMMSTESSVLYLLDNLVDVLIYQGNHDSACSTAGNLGWANSLRWTGQMEFVSKDLVPWFSTYRSKDGKPENVGKFKDVHVHMKDGDETKTTFAFVTIDASGHLVPMDQPEVALDMLTRWLRGYEFGIIHDHQAPARIDL